MKRKNNTMRLERKEPLTMGEMVALYIREMKLAPRLNAQRIFAAWDAVSGAAPFTLRRYFRSGALYITVSSSMIRNQLYFQKSALIEKMNEFLKADELFVKGDRQTGYVVDLILK